MQAFIRANCQQIAYIEALLMGTGTASKIMSGNSVPLWTLQKRFKPVVHGSEYELTTGKFFQLSGGVFPFKIKFEYHNLNNSASIQMSRRCLDAMQSMMPHIFPEPTEIEWPEGENIEIELNQSIEELIPKPKSAEAKHS